MKTLTEEFCMKRVNEQDQYIGELLNRESLNSRQIEVLKSAINRRSFFVKQYFDIIGNNLVDVGLIFEAINPSLHLLSNGVSIKPGSLEHRLLEKLWNKCD